MDQQLVEDFKKHLPDKPPDSAAREPKHKYSSKVSEVAALTLATEFRRLGLAGTRPDKKADGTKVGSERRMAGGIGAKNVDVTWASEESGLILGISVKSINFRDKTTKNFQKNLTNRRGDMLMESVTLHRRFPYAVLGGFFFLDADAAKDGTAKRRSTFDNAHSRLKLFTGRNDPAGREEQYESLYLILLQSAVRAQTSIRVFRVGDAKKEITLATACDELLQLVVERNPDFYEIVDGRLAKAPS